MVYLSWLPWERLHCHLLVLEPEFILRIGRGRSVRGEMAHSPDPGIPHHQWFPNHAQETEDQAVFDSLDVHIQGALVVLQHPQAPRGLVTLSLETGHQNFERLCHRQQLSGEDWVLFDLRAQILQVLLNV